jgi:hypothetical protein
VVKREAEHTFLSEDRDAAFQEVLRIGAAEEYSLMPTKQDKGAPTIDCRFAEVVYLEERGMGRTAAIIAASNATDVGVAVRARAGLATVMAQQGSWPMYWPNHFELSR